VGQVSGQGANVPQAGVQRARKRQVRQGRPWRRLQKRVIRDNDLCWICGQLVDKSVRWPDPMSASVDHVIPLTMGGELADPGNVRLAHMRCNSSRGNGSRRARRVELPQSRRW